MDHLFDQWKTKIPNYSANHKSIFESLSKKGGAEGEKMVSLGKHFSTNYELYMYAFFLGLYRNEFIPIDESEKKLNFSHHIQYWGNKSKMHRKDFSKMQEYIFSALIAHTDIDLLALDKGDISVDEVVKQLIYSLDSYANGGLITISEKIEDNSSYFLKPTSFLDMILDS